MTDIQSPERRGGFARSAALRDLARLYPDEYEELYRRYHDMLGGSPRVEARCGTRSGYNRHRREGTPTCAACREAQATYMRQRQERRSG